MITVTIKFGADETRTQLDSSTTIGDIKEDDNLRTRMGWGDNVNVLCNGVRLDDNVTVPDGSVLTVETAANKKAI